MSEQSSHSGDPRRPEIDFRRFFAATPDDVTTPRNFLPALQSKFDQSALDHGMQNMPLPYRRRIGWPTGANVIFATITFLGGLFCAFHFFNSVEQFSTVSIWPREVFYAHPFKIDHFATIDMFDLDAAPTRSLSIPKTSGDSPARFHSEKTAGKPISPLPRVGPVDPDKTSSRSIPSPGLVSNLPPRLANTPVRGAPTSSTTSARASAETQPAKTAAATRKTKGLTAKAARSSATSGSRTKTVAPPAKSRIDLKHGQTAQNPRHSPLFETTKQMSGSGFRSTQPLSPHTAMALRGFTPHAANAFHGSPSLSRGRP